VQCPVCREPLVVVERDRIELDWCPWCRGLWFDEGELSLLAETLGLTIDLGAPKAGSASRPGARPRSCPRCDRGLEEVRVGGEPSVALDRCPRGHGHWFEAGELATLVQQQPGASSAPDAALRFMGETLREGQR